MAIGMPVIEGEIGYLRGTIASHAAPAPHPAALDSIHEEIENIDESRAGQYALDRYMAKMLA